MTSRAPGSVKSLIDHLRDPRGDVWIDERRESARLRHRPRAAAILRQAFRQRFADLFGVSRYPDARSVDARAPAVVGDRSDHHIEILLPVVNAVFANDDLAVARTMNLNARIVAPETGRTERRRRSCRVRTAQDFAAAGVIGRIETERFARRAGAESTPE